ncbi:iron-sulfur cluster assembly accessory protein [Candidatus Woesearchaeota archaeon]|nr:iron-sulfur cluster assembly accessory protein [Candidatus Woesearchaeota archaeon]
MKTQLKQVTRDMTIGDIVSKHPDTAEVMLSHGLHCIGCHANPLETLEQGALSHGMDKKEFESMLSEINQIILNPKPKPQNSNKVMISKSATSKILELSKNEKKSSVFRIQVVPGGCSGFQYVMGFSEQLPDDHLIMQDNVKVVIDPDSQAYLKGSEIDFIDNLEYSGFKINNPNKKSSCGCGSSVGF